MNPFGSLAASICEVFPDLTPSDLEFAPAPKLEVGDIALRTFAAARKLRLPPPKFAQSVAEKVDFGAAVREVVPAGPYLNFRLDRAHFSKAIVAEVLSQRENFGSTGAGVGKNALIEHTSINPNASPHVGRARNAMIGDSLVRLFRFEGYDVDVQYYVNDMGRQIGLLVLVCEDLSALSFDEIL
ncbi:MAG: arginine--tRNA ligase, partial [Candidatus Hydrogenedentales bacterium]